MLRRTILRGCASATATAAATKKKIEIVECPRDAMQGLRDFIPTEKKIQYINALLKCGFDTVDFGSFVSEYAVPQMKDTAEVLAGLDETTSKLLAVVVNLKGAVRASQFDRIDFVGYPLSASETFQKKNSNKDIASSIVDLRKVQDVCLKSNKNLVTYISMGFGNPYGEDFNEEIVADLVEKVVKMDCKYISLADTVGTSEPNIITSLYTKLIPMYPDVTFSAHFHSGAVSSVTKVQAAASAGCHRIEGAIGGMGGCPFAKSTLVGNVSTEGIVEALRKIDLDCGLDMDQLRKCQEIKHDIFGVAVKELILASTLKNEHAFTRLCMEHFNRHDVHKMGYLEEPEFAKAMSSVFTEIGEEPPTEEKISKTFKKLDLSGNGVITLDEYTVGARRALTKRLQRMSVE